MKKRYTLPQLKKYDVNQKVIEALADVESRAILFSVIKREKHAADLAQKLSIPLSSVYKKIDELQDLGLIQINRWILSDKGRKIKMYKSMIRGAEIHIKKTEPVLSLIPNSA